MAGIETRFEDAHGRLSVSHEPSLHGAGNVADGVISLVAPDCEPDTLTRVAACSAGGTVVVYLHWQDRGTTGFSVFRHPNSRALFLGGGTLLAIVSRAAVVVHQAARFMVWGFELLGDHVVELGEIQCALYSADGALVSQVDVDPPYRIERSRDRLTFRSDVSGVRHLAIPGA